MSPKISKIVDFLTLERIEENIFRGESRDLGTPQVFGGQVLGQAMEAANLTVKDWYVHSVHAYFLRRGDFKAPIVYEVERSRDGGSFASRRVVAIQHGRPIFTMSASFQKEEPGLEFDQRIEMPPTPTAPARRETGKGASHAEQVPHSDFEVCYMNAEERTDPDSMQWWIKTRDALPDDARMHRAVLAYISDFGLLGSALLPHRKTPEQDAALKGKILYASIDHTIWFHRPFRADDWFLYYCRSISTSSARGLAQGSIYDSSGVLVASTMQEGLVRQI